MNAIVAFRDEDVKKNINDFCACFGGGIGLMGSYYDLTYTMPDKNTIYLQPGDETVEEFVKTLQESVRSSKNLIVDRWKLFVRPGPGVLY